MTNKKKVKESKKNTNESKENTQLNWMLGIMIGIFVIVVLVVLFRGTSNSFIYNGLEFEKIKYGEIILYRANVPIYDSSGGLSQEIELDFRKDPRTLEDYPVYLDDERISLKTENITYIGVHPDIEKCGDYGIAVINFGGLFFRKAGLTSNVGSTNKTRAKEEAVSYVSCENKSSTSILFVPGNKTEIFKTDDNCYELRINNCEVLEISEKFQSEILKQYIESLILNDLGFKLESTK